MSFTNYPMRTTCPNIVETSLHAGEDWMIICTLNEILMEMHWRWCVNENYFEQDWSKRVLNAKYPRVICIECFKVDCC